MLALSIPILLTALGVPRIAELPQTPHSAEAQEPAAPLVVRDWLVIGSVDGRRGRRPFAADSIFSRYLLRAGSPIPSAGEAVRGVSGRTASWEARRADENGSLSGRHAYAYARLEVDSPRVMLAELSGADRLYVNTAGVQGDLYRYGFGGVPVYLRAGVNHLFVTGIRGGFQLRLLTPPARLVLADWDRTLPNFAVGTEVEDDAAVVVYNASLDPVPRLFVVCGGVGPFERKRSLIDFGLPPLGVTKVPLNLAAREGHPLPTEPGTVKLRVSLGGHAEQEPAVTWIDMAVVGKDARRLRTYRSRVDGSVQRYGVVVPNRDPARDDPVGMVLSLHGASVSASAQAGAYSRHPDLWIVAPENRRPFGFDWQDWGRIDAYEVLETALSWTGADARRLYLTGHSMGGHGAWHLAANDPDRWAAVGPSAGWVDFRSYTGIPPMSPQWEALWRAADPGSDTQALLGNLAQLPTYVLHGTADDNVPASHAYWMRQILRAAGARVESHFQEGAGHWWDGEASPGVDCVDWPAMFDFFRKHERAFGSKRLDFVTADPSVDAEHDWLRIEQPLRYGSPIRVRASYEEESQRIRIETSNARRFSLQLPSDWKPETFEIDGQVSSPQSDSNAHHFLRGPEGWSSERFPVRRGEKHAQRSGPFKKAFDQNFLMVYATLGDSRENFETLHRVLCDSQAWTYRGNGTARIVTDRDFQGGIQDLDFGSRNLILYGNADTHEAWEAALGRDCPIQVRRGEIRLGDRRWEGEDLACLFVWPRAGEERNLVGVFGHTGADGARLGYLLRPFTSGLGYPDYVIFDASLAERGESGVLAAGWFDAEWKLQAPF